MTLGRLARTVNLARATLLYYESQGLLKPAQRSAAGYRLYGPSEIERLNAIRRLRSAGLSVGAVRELLPDITRENHRANRHTKTTQPAALLENRLLELCREAEQIREQQKLLAQILATTEIRRVDRSYKTKSAWVALLSRAGFSDADMRHWHQSFETTSPREHAAFLRSLGLSPPDVSRIRKWSKSRDAES